MPNWNLDIDWEGKTQKKTASKRWNLNVDWGKEPDTTFDTSKLATQTFAGGRKDATYVKGTGVSEQPQRDIYRSPVLETLQAPVKAIGQGIKEIGEGKVAEGTIDILSGTLKGAMLPITAPLTEVDELLKQSGDVGSAIAEAGAKIMNIPFDAVNGLSDITEKGLNLIGTSGKEIDKSLGISEGVSQKGSDLIREIAGLLTMVYGAKYTKAVINRYQENVPKMLIENAQRKIEANPELKAQFEEMTKPKPIDIPKVAEKTTTGEPLTPQEAVIAKEMPREVELAKKPIEVKAGNEALKVGEELKSKPEELARVEDALKKSDEELSVLREKFKENPEQYADEYQNKITENQGLGEAVQTAKGETWGLEPTQVYTDINAPKETRGLSLTTEAKSIAKGITEGFEKLPEYDVRKTQPQIEKASELITTDLARAKRIALGEEGLPEGASPDFVGFVYKGLEDYAIKNGDSVLASELARSEYLSQKATGAGQLIQSLRNQDPDSPVKAIKEIIQTREESWGRTNLTTKAKELETRVKDLESKLSLKEEQLQKIDSEKAYKTLKRQVDYQARKENRTYTKEALKEERSTLYTDLYKEISNLNAGVPLSGKAVKILGELTKSYAKEGLLNAEAVVDAIYVELKNQVDKRTIRDAISKYGVETKKTRSDLTKSVSDLKQQMTAISKIEDIESGKVPIKKEVTRGQQSENLQVLREELKTKLDEYGITEQENLTKSKQQIIKKIGEYNQKINAGDYEKPEKIAPTDPEKATLQKQLDDVRGQWNYVQKSLGDVLSPEEAKYITDLSKQISDAKEKMNSVPRRKNLGKATPEEMEYGRARVAFAEYVDGLKEGAKKMTFEEFKSKPIKTVGEALKHIPGITKSAKATLDDSGLFNQGMPVLMTNPVIWQRNALQSFRDIANTFGGKNVLAEVSADIISRPNYELYKKDGLAVGVVEEAFPDSRLLERIPLLGRVHKAADAAFTAFAYRNRADLYDYYTDLAKKSGIEETTGLGIGKLANSLTGRGYLGGLEKSATTINNVFFSPRLVKSRFDILTAHTLSKDISPFVRKQAALNLLKIVGATAGVMATVKALGGNVELDPRSSDFGKIKIGDTRFNFTGGMNSLVTLGSKIITSSTKNSRGEVKDLNTGKFGSQTSWEVFENFMEGKLSPVAGVLRDVMKGQTFSGERPTIGGELKNLVVPLPITNFEELASNPNSAPIIAAMLADALGIFTNTYSDDPDLRKVKNTLLRDDKLKGEAKMNFYKSLNKSLKKGVITKEQYKDYRTEFEEIQKTAKRSKQ